MHHSGIYISSLWIISILAGVCVGVVIGLVGAMFLINHRDNRLWRAIYDIQHPRGNGAPAPAQQDVTVITTQPRARHIPKASAVFGDERVDTNPNYFSAADGLAQLADTYTSAGFPGTSTSMPALTPALIRRMDEERGIVPDSPWEIPYHTAGDPGTVAARDLAAPEIDIWGGGRSAKDILAELEADAWTTAR